MPRYKVLVLVSPSSSGKDYILSKLCEMDRFNRIVSHTTRPIRVNEINSVSYFFVGEKEFNSTDMIETRIYHTLMNGVKQDWMYGLSSQELSNKMQDGKIPVVILDLQGLKELETYAQSNGINVVSIFIQVPFLIRLYRAIKRGSFSLIEFIRRSLDDHKKMSKGYLNTTYMVKNTKHIDKTVSEIIKLLDGEL